jgi:hypothetical protein
MPVQRAEYFVREQEVWPAAECRRRANHTAKDGMGTPYPFKGYIGSNQPNGGQWGKTRYNGGCVRNGKRYAGEIRNLPVVAPGFRIITVPGWGFRIIRTGENDNAEMVGDSPHSVAVPELCSLPVSG